MGNNGKQRATAGPRPPYVLLALAVLLGVVALTAATLSLLVVEVATP